VRIGAPAFSSSVAQEWRSWYGVTATPHRFP
jgi:hypothetical protein